MPRTTLGAILANSLKERAYDIHAEQRIAFPGRLRQKRATLPGGLRFKIWYHGSKNR